MKRTRKDEFNLLDITKINYSDLCLISNPFPSISIPDLLPSVTADRKEILDSFKDNLRQTIFENRSVIMIMSGHWGTGKSHLLKFFKYKVNSQLLNSENRAIAVYLKSLGKSFLDFYTYFIDDVGRDFLTSVSNQIILNYFTETDENSLKKYLLANDNSTTIKSSSIEEILVKSQFYDIFYDIKIKNPLISSDVMYALLCLSHPDYSSISWRWFAAENLGMEDRKLIRVDGNIDNDNAIKIVEGIANAIIKSGIETLVILIDEFEGLSLINKNQRNRYLNEIRHFIDDNPTKMLMVVGTSPTAYAEMTEKPTALTRRLSGQEFELSRFQLKDIKELITRYISIHRIDDDESLDTKVKSVKDSDEEIYPFTNKAIDEINNRTLGNVGSTLKLCKVAIDFAVKNKAKIIDENIIQQVKI